VTKTITFEQPLNERVRTLVRLEFLFRQARHDLAGESAWDSRHFIATLLDILALLSRTDLKTEFIKETERHIGALSRFLENDTIDQDYLSNILRHLEYLRSQLHGTKGQLARALREDNILTAVRRRATVPGGSSEFDLPNLHLWLNRSARERKDTQQVWLDQLKLIRQGTELLLKLIRGSAGPSSETAIEGGFQRNLDRDTPYQLLRVSLEPESGVYPEISAGKHRFAIRFLEPAEGGDRQTQRNIPFQLTCCAL